ncbi:MAG TPA: hypothetical protein VG960_01505, partial [Caulobacteraceae bacterium]|nr:hypothetical protein [Caulobacteraceae bacterium]
KDYTAALLQGGQALDDWKVKDAGRQALEKVGLAEKPKLTAAEQALAATIRQRAEETERLKLANERLTKASDLARTADLETQALRDQAVAAMQGEQALEDYRVKQAGLQVLQQEGVQSLDQLTGKTLEQTKAAIASAEAKERQAIATEKAQKVGGELRDLDRRIASERAHTASLADGTKAEVDYARAEFERQEIERAGTNITAEQIEKIKTKADLLFRLQGAAEAASDKKAFEQDLKFAAMTADEREREQRALQLSAQIIKTNPSLSQAEADGLARVQAEWEQQQTLRANDIGQLRDSLRQTFIESGQLGFDDVGKYVEQRLRKAVYDALLAKPIDMVINAVVGSVTGLSGLGGSAAGGGDLLGIGGLLQSAVPGLGAASSLGGLLGSAGIGSLLGSAIGVKGTSSGAANAGLALGGSYLGSLAGTALIDAGSMGVGGALGGSALMGLGSIAGPLGALAAIAIGGLLGGSKPSNFMASASFGAGGSYVLGGDKPNANTTSAATSVATAIQGAIQALDKIGVQADGVISRIEIGQRDASVIQLANGQRLSTPVGDQKALTDAVSKALLQNAGYSDPQLKSLVDQMIAANSSFDQISRALQAASDAIGVFGDKIDQSVAAALLPQRAKMQAWLDSLDVGQTTTLNPMEQRGAAYADYSRVFGQAQSGDADAIANLSAYADRLLQADQQATSSAAERAAMEEMVKSQVAGLFALTRSDPLSPTFDLGEVAQAASQTVAGPVSAGAVAAPPGNSVAAAIQRMSDVLESRLSALQSAMATVDDTAHNGLSAVVDQLAQCVDLARQELNVAALTQQYVRYNPLGNAGR